eukprot:superscaffoldBa00000163_g2314
MLCEANDNTADGIYISFRTDGSIFNLQRQLPKMKTLEQLVLELLFPDDCALIAHIEEALQCIVNCFAKAGKAPGLTISLKKTDVMYQSPLGVPYSRIKNEGTKLNTVEHFTNLGSVMSNEDKTSKDLDNCLGVWQDHSLRLSTSRDMGLVQEI